MNLISGTHRLCERREYVFMVFREYTIIFSHIVSLVDFLDQIEKSFSLI